MANNKINLSLSVTADTEKAKALLKSLLSLLDLLTRIDNKTGLGITDDIHKANLAATLLKVQLQNATNVDTGRLDLTKFNESLKQSGKSLGDYKDLLTNMGPQGKQAFATLASSILDADVPLKRVNSSLKLLKDSIANAARWQISSSIIHGFMGAVSSAYGYAQDLNKSLNDIRIVTGYNTDLMANFAVEANKAAKALSTTTTEYTNASLIYYQQGNLSDEEINERTAITIKMANAAGESALKVSDQLTAVWNNFYDGSKSLEYYADVMTALGAATASSTDEISQGVNKFASVADTVGLSYEYATSALATVTATTRESADVVGTAFKTLFARIQGLKLGETLDDGTTLNKYSQALDKVGISIFELNGELKAMDNILDELGAKWDTLATSEKTALALTVAGVRQYTLLVALMDKWDYFQQNLGVAQNASGTLDEQAEIYAESWEAALNRVRAAAEGVYDSLINDEFFIDVLNGFEKIIGVIDNTIDAMGGLGGVVSTVGAILIKAFKPEIAKNINNIGYNIKKNLGIAKEENLKLQKEANDMLSNLYADRTGSEAGGAISTAFEARGRTNNIFLQNAEKMSDLEKLVYKSVMDTNKALTDRLAVRAEAIELAEAELDILAKDISFLDLKKPQEFLRKKDSSLSEKRSIIDLGEHKGRTENNRKAALKEIEQFKTTTKTLGRLEVAFDPIINKAKTLTKELYESLKGFKEFGLETDEAMERIGDAFSSINKELLDEHSANYFDKINDKYAELKTLLDKIKNSDTFNEEDIITYNTKLNELKSDVSLLVNTYIEGKRSQMTFTEGGEQLFLELASAARAAGIDLEQFIQKCDGARASSNRLGEEMGKTSKKAMSFGDKIALSMDLITTSVSAIESIKGITETIKDPETDGWQEFVAILTSLGTTASMVIPTITALVAAGGAIAWPIIGVTGAIAALVGVIVAINRESNKHNIEAEKAKKTVNELQQSYEELKTTISEVKTSFSEYDTAINALKECLRGTEEWNNALLEVNDSTTELLKKYPELLAQENLLVRDETTGALVINKEARENILNNLELLAQVANVAAILGNVRVSEKALEADSEELRRKIAKIEMASGVLTAEKIVENADLFAEANSSEEYLKILKEIGTLGSLTTEVFNESLAATAESLWSYRDDITALSNKTKNFNNQLEQTGLLLVDSVLADNENLTVELRDSYSVLGGRIYNKEIDQIEKTIIEDGKKDSRLFNSTQDAKDIWERFNRAKFGDDETLWLQANKNLIQGSGDERKFVDAEGKEYSIEFIASTIAAAEGLEKLELAAKEAQKAFNQIDKNLGEDSGLGLGIKDFITTGTFLSLNLTLAQEVLNSLLEQNAEKFVDSVFGENIDSETAAKYLGFDNIETAMSSMRDSANELVKGFEEIPSKLSNTPKKIYNTLLNESELKNSSYKAQLNVANSLQDIFKKFGSEGTFKFELIFKSFGKDSDLLAEQLSKINWEEATPEDLIERLRDLEIQSIPTNDNLLTLINLMSEIAEVDLEPAIEKYRELKELSRLETGSVVDEDIYNNELPEEVKSLFTKTLEGYMLTGDESAYKDYMREARYTSVEESIQQDEDKKNKLEVITKFDNFNLLSSITGGAASKSIGLAQTKFDALSRLNFEGATDALIKEWNKANLDKSFTSELSMAMSEALSRMVEYSEDYNLALTNTNKKIQDTKKALDFSKLIDRIEDLELSFEDVNEKANEFKVKIGDNEEVLTELEDRFGSIEAGFMAMSIWLTRATTGINNLNTNYKDYIKTLSDPALVNTESYFTNFESLKTDLANIFDVDAEALDDGYIEKRFIGDPEKLAEIAAGNKEVILSYIEEVQIMAAFNNAIELNVELDESEKLDVITELNELITNVPDTIEMALKLDGLNSFINKLKKVVEAAGVTSDEVNRLLGTMGMEQEVEVIEVRKRVGGTKVTTFNNETRLYEDEWVGSEYITVPTIRIKAKTGTTTSNNKGNSLGQYMDFGTTNDPLASSGGSKSEPKATEKIDVVKKKDMVDPYKEIDDLLESIQREYDKIAKQEDTLFGESKLDNLRRQQKELQKLLELLQKKNKLLKDLLAVEKDSLINAGKKYGFDFEFMENGDIANQTELMTNLYEELKKAQEAWNEVYKDKTAEEQLKYEEEVIKPIQDKIDELKEIIQIYEDALATYRTALEEEIDIKNQLWDKHFLELNVKLELNLVVNEMELERIDYYLNKLSDDFYSMAEAGQYMMAKIPNAKDALGDYEKYYNDISAAYAAGQISLLLYVDGLREARSGILDNLQALNELDKQMLHYYEDTLAAAAEELGYYTDLLEHLTGVLDHYRTIVELVNGEFDYDSIDTILRARSDTLKNEVDVATANYEMLMAEKAAIEASLNGAANEAEREVFEKELRAITTAVNEAQEEMLSKTEAWAENMKEIMTNAMAQSAHEMELALTDGMGFDLLNNSIDRLSSYADEYLTKTNLIYEVLKLMNKAQLDADKTTNEAAKNRINNFIKESEALKDKNKLSNLELEIQKAKYEVLLAEIALEEALKAKATVRLQRDSEGNYGYVYTADLDAVQTAEQDLLDAQNRLYNIGLEGTNEYGQKLIELKQQLADLLILLEEMRAAGEFATDADYYAARDLLIAEYTDLFTAYSEQYTTALGVDAAIQEEAWINAYSHMIDLTTDWKEVTTTYTNECENAYSQWRQTVLAESLIIDRLLNDLEGEVGDVTRASLALAQQVTSTVIPRINSELAAVRNLTAEYARLRLELLQLINTYELLANKMQLEVAAEVTKPGIDLSDYDPTQDYSRLAADAYAQNNMLLFEKYLKYREYKLNTTPNASNYNITEDMIRKYLAEEGYLPLGMFFTLVDWSKYGIDYAGYATGGYTGSWGPDGRLAILHEKELVLNADDTKNFLTATTALRELSKLIDLEAMSNRFAFDFGSLFSNFTNDFGSTIEQRVLIEAHFPNATDRNEISEALNNLINTASLYANRKV